jgi:hypothetical protein
MSDDPVTECQVCGRPVQRVFHPVAVHFKGSGFYNTDYGKQKRGAGAAESSGSDSKSDSGSDSGSSSGSTSSDGASASNSSGGGEKSSSGSSSGSSPKPSSSD